MADFFAESEHYRWAELRTDNGTIYNLYDFESLHPGSRMTLEVHEHQGAFRRRDTSSGARLSELPPGVSFGTEHFYDVDAVISEEALPSTATGSTGLAANDQEPELKNMFKGKVHSVLAIRLCYKDSCPHSEEHQIREWLWDGKDLRSNNDALYRETSYGLVSFPKELGAVMTVHIDKNVATDCNVHGMMSDGTAAAKAMHQKDSSSPNPDSFMHITWYNPSKAGCNWGGIGWMGTPWRPQKNTFMNMGGMLVIAHELGHNVGASHDATDRDDDGEQDHEYGDGTGLMGQGVCGFTAPRRALFGYLPQSAQVTHPGCGPYAPTEVALRALDLFPTAGSASLIRIPRHGGGYYYVSFRRDHSYDTNMRRTYKNKVIVHVRNSNWNPMIIGALDKDNVCKVNGKSGGEGCVASNQGWSGKTVGGQTLRLQVKEVRSESATVLIHAPQSACPAREGLSADEEPNFNPALSSYSVNGKCDYLGIEGFPRPRGEHGLGNENNLDWCNEGGSCSNVVDAAQCGEGKAELIFAKSNVRMLGCSFAHYAQYSCHRDVTRTFTTTTAGPTTTTTTTTRAGVSIRNVGSDSCLKSDGRGQLLKETGDESCAKFTIVGKAFKSNDEQGFCLDWFSGRGWGLWGCHGGGNQQLVADGSGKWCSGSNCAIVFGDDATTSTTSATTTTTVARTTSTTTTSVAASTTTTSITTSTSSTSVTTSTTDITSTTSTSTSTTSVITSTTDMTPTTSTLGTTTRLPETSTTTTTSTGTATADKRLAAYWDYEECDPSGVNNQNWDWCGGGEFDCPQSRSVSTSICPSGRAKLVSSKTFFQNGNCIYAYYAQYACEEPDSRLTAYWDLGNCGHSGDDQHWDWCSAWKFDCPVQQEVSQEICASGMAVRVQMESFVKKDGCFYAYHAQYACSDRSSTEASSISMGSEHGNRRLRGTILAEDAVASSIV
jgi:hypothetical protein